MEINYDTIIKYLTKNINKAMLPIDNKAIISYIIEKFPKEYEFVVCLGYKGEELKQYCQLAYPYLHRHLHQNATCNCQRALFSRLPVACEGGVKVTVLF